MLWCYMRIACWDISSLNWNLALLYGREEETRQGRERNWRLCLQFKRFNVINPISNWLVFYLSDKVEGSNSCRISFFFWDKTVRRKVPRRFIKKSSTKHSQVTRIQTCLSHIICSYKSKLYGTLSVSGLLSIFIWLCLITGYYSLNRSLYLHNLFLCLLV